MGIRVRVKDFQEKTDVIFQQKSGWKWILFKYWLHSTISALQLAILVCLLIIGAFLRVDADLVSAAERAFGMSDLEIPDETLPSLIWCI